MLQHALGTSVLDLTSWSRTQHLFLALSLTAIQDLNVTTSMIIIIITALLQVWTRNCCSTAHAPAHCRYSKRYAASLAYQYTSGSTSCAELRSLSAECHQALAALGATYCVMVVLAIIGVVYAAQRRTQIRKQFGIAGSRLGDICTWCW